MRPEAYLWRTQAGAEVDLLLVRGRRMMPIEIKLGTTVDARTLAGLRQCMTDLGLTRGFVIYGGDDRWSIGGSIELLPWDAIARREMELPW